MADKSSTGAVHLTTLDLDVSKVFEQLNEISQKVQETAEQVKNTPFTLGGDETTNNPLGDLPQQTEQAVSSTRESIEKLIGQYLNLEKTITQFRATGDGTYVFRNISAGIDDAISKLSGYSEALKNGAKLTKEETQTVGNLRESLVLFTNQVKEADNALLKSGESLNSQKNKIASLAESYNKFVVSLEKSNFDVDYEPFKDLKREAESSASAMQSLYNKIKSGDSVSSIQVQQFNSLSRSLSDYKTRLSELKLTAEQTGQGLKSISETSPDFSKYIKSIENLNLQYKTFQNTLSRSNLKAGYGKQVEELKFKTNEFAKQVEDLTKTVQNNGTVTKEQASAYDTLKSNLTGLKGEFKDIDTAARNAGGGIQDFLIKLSDKVKWMAAYQLIMLVRNAISGIVGTIKNAEDSVVELQRVLNENISSITISDELQNIAYEFGQSFENVSEVALRFAQTGKSWNEVIDSTRATMLGLNTAELEVSTATEGLIAVMAQFGLKASELETVIDKINITADNFPVTSEKIVSALQRAGGTASAFNMTLEETIATITALAEKTGRSGENIGTALNSLIIFTNKSDNLKLFSSLSSQMDEVVKKFQSGSGSIIEVWEQLGKEIENLSNQQKDALFDSTAFEEFADSFEAEAAEYAASIQQIYGTAGAYRRNYLTVLLQDIGTVQDVLDNMLDAEGYSLAENAKYMETLTAKIEQLKIAWQELAVQLGNSGLMDILKWSVDLATGILKVTKQLGGLSSVIILFATALVQAKVSAQGLPEILQKIENAGKTAFNFVTAPIRNIVSFFKTFTAECKSGKNAVEALKATMATFDASAMVTAIGAAVFAINLIITKVREYRQEQAKLREETISRGNEAKKTADNIYELYSAYFNAEKQYADGVETQRAYEEATNNLKNALAEQGAEVDNLSVGYKNLSKEMKDAAIEAMQSNLFEQEAQIQAAKEKLEAFVKENKNLGLPFKNWNFTQETDYDHALKVYSEMEEKLKAMQEEGLKAGKSIEEIVSDKAYQSISKYYYALKPLVDEVEDSQEKFEEISEKIENLKNDTVELTDATNDLGESIQGISPEELAENIETLSKAFESLSSKVDKFQSSYSTLVDIINEYNQTGRMTADQMQTLLGLEPEYIALLEEKNGQLGINQEKLNELVAVNDNYMIQLAALKLAEQAEIMIEELKAKTTAEMTKAEIEAAIASQMLAGDLQNAALAMLTGKDNGELFRRKLEEIASSSGLAGNQIEFLMGKVNGLSDSYKNLLNYSNLAYTMQTTDIERRPGETGSEYRDRVLSARNQSQINPSLSTTGIGYYYTPKTSKSSSSGKSAAETALENEKKAIKEVIRLREDELYFMEKSGASADEMIAKYKELQSSVHEQADRYRRMGVAETDEALREMGKSWWKYQEEIEKIITEVYETNVDSYKNAIEALEHDYSHLEQTLDYSGMADNLQAQIEYQKKIQESANKEFERLINKGVDVNSDAIQSVVKDWRDACDTITDLNEKLANDILRVYDEFISLADAFDVWDTFDFTKVDYLKDKMQEINKLFKEGTLTLSQYKELLESTGKALLEAQVQSLEDSKNDIKDRYDTIIKGYKDQIDRIKDQKKASDKYYDGLIDNLRDVEDANERINAQLDYYANRQKILRNLEQAQARSGVEWREKEIQYQEELANLDENWRRTQDGWSISDQIAQLEKLKKEAADRFEDSIARLEEYIDNAEKESEQAIENVSKEIEALKKKIYDAITAELKTAKESADALQDSMKNVGDNAKPSIESLGKYFKDTLNGSIKSVGDTLKTTMAKDGEIASKSLADAFSKNFVQPISSQISSVMKQATSPAAVSKATSSSITTPTNVSTSSKTTTLQGKVKTATTTDKNKPYLSQDKVTGSKTSSTNNTVNVYADLGSNSSPNALNSLVNKISSFFTNPSRF